MGRGAGAGGAVGAVELSGPPGFARRVADGHGGALAGDHAAGRAGAKEALQGKDPGAGDADASAHAHRGALAGGFRRRIVAQPQRAIAGAGAHAHAHSKATGAEETHAQVDAQAQERQREQHFTLAGGAAAGSKLGRQPAPPPKQPHSPKRPHSKRTNPYRQALSASARGLDRAVRGSSNPGEQHQPARGGAQSPQSAPSEGMPAPSPSVARPRRRRASSAGSRERAGHPRQQQQQQQQQQQHKRQQHKRQQQQQHKQRQQDEEEQQLLLQADETGTLQHRVWSSPSSTAYAAGTATRTLRDKVSVLARECSKKDEAIQVLLVHCAQKDNAVAMLTERIRLLQEEVQLLTDAEADAVARATKAEDELAILAKLHGIGAEAAAPVGVSEAEAGRGQPAGGRWAGPIEGTQHSDQEPRGAPPPMDHVEHALPSERPGRPERAELKGQSSLVCSQPPAKEVAESAADVEVDEVMEQLSSDVAMDAGVFEGNEGSAGVPDPEDDDVPEAGAEDGEGEAGTALWSNTVQAGAYMAMAARREGSMQMQLERERERSAALQRDFELLEGALSECVSQKRAFAARYHFCLLDDDHDGLIGPAELRRYETFAQLDPWVLDRVLQCWNFQSGKYGRVCIDDFLGLVRHSDYKATSEAVAFWFRVVDVDEDGYLGRCDLRQFYDTIDDTDAPPGALVGFDDLLCQLHDMVQAKDPERGISLRQVRNSKLAPTFFNLILNHGGAVLNRAAGELQ